MREVYEDFLKKEAGGRPFRPTPVSVYKIITPYPSRKKCLADQKLDPYQFPRAGNMVIISISYLKSLLKKFFPKNALRIHLTLC